MAMYQTDKNTKRQCKLADMWADVRKVARGKQTGGHAISVFLINLWETWSILPVKAGCACGQKCQSERDDPRALACY
jgi:hypothetical protein